MPTGRNSRAWRGALLAPVLALMTVGVATAPAEADTTRSKQWFLDAMQAEGMWKSSKGEGVTVAVIDTGVDAGNPDLRGRVLEGKDFAPDSRAGDEHDDYDGHGTGMAGLIAGTGAYGGGNGAFGLAPAAKILPVRMPEAGDVSPFAVNEIVGKAIRYAVDAGAQVINISATGGNESEEVTAAVSYALGKGSLVFAAVGNEGKTGSPVQYPAATPGVVGVAAVGKDLGKTDESNAGPQVDMAAPGDEMVHACGGDTGLCETHGTSDATALASASAALIWSKHPDWTNNQVLRVMLNTIGAPTDGAKRNDGIGYGIVRPRIALKTPGDPGPAGEYPLPDYPAKASPSAEPSKSEGAPAAHAPSKGEPAAASEGGSGNGMLWVGVGAAGVVLLGAAVAVPVVRNRRRTV